jgi:hypothetical protein
MHGKTVEYQSGHRPCILENFEGIAQMFQGAASCSQSDQSSGHSPVGFGSGERDPFSHVPKSEAGV